MRLKKLTTDTASFETIDIVDNTYVLLGTEEWIESAFYAEQFYYCSRVDYIRFRKYLKYLADNFWETLDANDRHICVDNYVKPAALSWEATGYTDEELFRYWTTMVDLEKQCRIQRMNRCIERITWFFTGEQSMLCYSEIKQLIEDWKQCEFPELYCFVNSLNLTILGLTFDYSTTGFASKSYYTLDRLNLVNTILFND